MKKVSEPRFIKATNEGRIYIKTSDFFRQEKVRAQISELMKSSIYKKIEGKKND